VKRLTAALWASVVLACVAACSASGNPTESSGSTGGAGGTAASGGASGASGSGGTISDGGLDGPYTGTTVTVIGSGADASAPGKFGGADDPSAKPTFVYPESGILVPPNMNSLEFHFIPGAGQTLFRFTFTSPTLQYVEYVGCTPLASGCVYKPDPQFWSKLANAARGMPPVSYSVSGVDGASPGAIGTSATQTIAFTNEDIVGGLYYWNTAGVIQRYDFGKPNLPAELFMTPAMDGALTCVGCHALSRDGTKMLVGADIPAPAPYKIYDVATRTVLQAGGKNLTGNSNFSAFSPDGTQLLFSSGSKIGWRDLTTGQIVNPTLIPVGAMPDWSPDGSMMVYAKPANAMNLPTPGITSASIELLHYDATNKVWGNPKTLVPFQGANNYYPAFSPAGNWIVFNRSPANNNSYANGSVDPQNNPNPDGQLWAVPAAGGAPIQLAQATGTHPSSWPKWAPDVATYYGGKVMWLTYSSSRPYGLRLANGQRTQLWMTAFDPDKAAHGKDPSFPSFWLPFQAISGGNEIAQWVTQVQRKPCTTASDCGPSEDCENGLCYPAVH
jgi:WD40-like Beta Propeller Repeat